MELPTCLSFMNGFVSRGFQLLCSSFCFGLLPFVLSGNKKKIKGTMSTQTTCVSCMSTTCRFAGLEFQHHPLLFARTLER